MTFSKDNRIFSRFLLITFIFFASLELIYAIIGVYSSFNIALLFLNCCIFIPLFFRSKNIKHNFVLDPYYMYGLWFALSYLISTTPIYIGSDTSALFESVNVNPFRTENIHVIIALGFGILLFYLGYNLVSSRNAKKSDEVSMPHSLLQNLFKIKKYLWGIYLYSVLFRLWGYSIGALGSLAADRGAQWPSIPLISVFVFLANMWPVYLGGVILYELNRKNKQAIIVLLIIELFFVLMSGDRRNVISIFFIFLFCYRIINKELPWPVIKIAIPVALLSLPLLTLIGYAMIYTDEINLSSFSIIFSLAADRLLSLSLKEAVVDFIYQPIIASFGYISNVYVAYTDFALSGDTWGSVGIHNVFSKQIPGFLGGGSFDERLYYQLFAEKYLTYKVDYSFLTFTFQSEMVLSYGLIAIPLGMFIQGIFAAFLFRLLQRRDCSPLYFVFYCGFSYKFALGLLSGMLTPDYILCIRALFYLCIILIFVKFFSKPKKQLSLMKK